MAINLSTYSHRFYIKTRLFKILKQLSTFLLLYQFTPAIPQMPAWQGIPEAVLHKSYSFAKEKPKLLTTLRSIFCLVRTIQSHLSDLRIAYQLESLSPWLLIYSSRATFLTTWFLTTKSCSKCWKILLFQLVFSCKIHIKML